MGGCRSVTDYGARLLVAERWARRGSADSSRSMKKLIQTMDSHDESMSEGSDYGFYDLSENLSTGE